MRNLLFYPIYKIYFDPFDLYELVWKQKYVLELFKKIFELYYYNKVMEYIILTSNQVYCGSYLVLYIYLEIFN